LGHVRGYRSVSASQVHWLVDKGSFIANFRVVGTGAEDRKRVERGRGYCGEGWEEEVMYAISLPACWPPRRVSSGADPAGWGYGPL